MEIKPIPASLQPSQIDAEKRRAAFGSMVVQCNSAGCMRKRSDRRLPAWICVLLALFAIVPADVFAQELKGTSSVGGRVTVSGGPAADILVTLDAQSLGKGVRFGPYDERKTFTERMRTDADGRFQFLNLPAGTFRLSAGSFVYTLAGTAGDRWKSVTLDEGETIENVSLPPRAGQIPLTPQARPGRGSGDPAALERRRARRVSPRSRGREERDRALFMQTDEVFRADALKDFVPPMNAEERRRTQIRVLPCLSAARKIFEEETQ